MIWSFIFFQGIFVCVTIFAAEENRDSRSAYFTTRENKQLVGHVVKQFESPSFMSCSQSCLRNPWCTSTNFRESSKEEKKGTCELNKNEIAPIDEDTHLIDKPGVTFSTFLKGCLMTGCLNDGSCLFDKKKETFTCSCKLPWSGNECEVNMDINECASNPCLNGATCTDNFNGFTCACSAYFTGMRCELGLGPECNSYTLDKAADRSITHAKVGSSQKCDSTLVAGWYRFNSTAGSKMPASCVSSNMCNTHASGWLNGAHPTPQEGVVNRNACFNWEGNCCNWKVAIDVRNCGLFYVYKLVKPANCTSVIVLPNESVHVHF